LSSGGFAAGGGGRLGGTIFNYGGMVTVLTSTLTANSAPGGTGNAGGKGLGGAVFNGDGTVSILFSTLSGNTAAQGGRDVFNLSDGTGQTGTAQISNSILGQSGNTTITDFNSTAVNGGNDPVNSGQSDLMSNPGTFPKASLVPATDPLLAPLAANGGPTQTLALLPGSPAIDAGDTGLVPPGLTTDQRGFARLSGSPAGKGKLVLTPAGGRGDRMRVTSLMGGTRTVAGREPGRSIAARALVRQ
jgi:hypothetical protein